MNPRGRQTVAAAFRNAFVGIADFVRERNSCIQLMAAATAIGLAVALRLTRVEWVALVLTITMVLTLEAINCAVERVVDLASPEYHELARQAKDLAAGAVLTAAVASVVIGALLFAPHLADIFR